MKLPEFNSVKVGNQIENRHSLQKNVYKTKEQIFLLHKRYDHMAIAQTPVYRFMTTYHKRYIIAPR